ncbi:glycosyltransferase family 9 protein [Rubellicoccus peritrichatus]|uniref:Glycosyltransferase family 9 protein n=1 Tax=Rubellicoccus peritrichatus TaxID=3080537 RepID=A0AAQ3LH74_9BACT|nr:glycosyltransferase family 9 protein [Puniceicoccus sp. CR14]WOO43738.1 glycosyltransferase family 9 protein [Puniceicoccus sp. CR14]
MLCRLLGDIIFFLPTKRRHMLLSNFHHCFPDRSREWREKTARESCRRIIEMATFILVSPHMSKERLRKRFSIDPEFARRIKENADEERPAILLIPHFAMMEALTILPGLIDGPMQHCATIYRPLKQAAIEKWVLDTRQRFGMELLSRKKGFNRAQEILRDKGVVAVLFDQNAGSRGLLTTFFGRVVASTELPGLLAAKFDARIGGIYTEHTGFWRGTVRLNEFECPEDSSQVVFKANQWLEQKLTDDENICADWLWLHNRWRHQDEPHRRLRLESKRNRLEETLAYQDLSALPRRSRFWIRLPNWLGDVVMAVPLISALRKGRPDAEVTLLAQSHFIPLLEKLELAERLIAIPKKGETGYLKFFKELREDYPDVHILLTNSTRGDLEARAIRAPQRFGIERPGKRRKLLSHTWPKPTELDEAEIHQTYLWEKFFQHFGLQEALDLHPIRIASTQRKQTEAIGLICATENSPEKRWPVERWRELIQAMPDKAFHLFGTSRDVEITNAVADGFSPDRVINQAGKTGLVEFAEALCQCEALICNDTGGMHLANMLGVPVVVIYGPTNPVRTGPIFNGQTEIIQPEGCPRTGGSDIAKVKPDEVVKAYNNLLAQKRDEPETPRIDGQ